MNSFPAKDRKKAVGRGGIGLWRPAASGTSGHVYPAQMFVKYLIDIDSAP